MTCAYNSRPAVNSIAKSHLINALTENGVKCDFGASGNHLADTIDQMLMENKIDSCTINKIYYDLILFGKHRCCYISEFVSINGDKLEAGILKLEEDYEIKEPFIDFISSLTGGEKVVALKKNFAYGVLDSINIVFRDEIIVTIKESTCTIPIFIPIIVYISQKKVLVMVNPIIDGAKEKEHMHSSIAKRYLEKVRNIFDMTWVEIKEKYAAYNFNLTLNFINEAYNIAMGNKIIDDKKQFEDVISSSSINIMNYLKNDLKLVILDEKEHTSILYDIRENIKSIIENAAISNYIMVSENGISKTSEIGYVTYLKFQDRAKSLTRMQGDGYSKPIMDSDAFLSLRNYLKKYRDISALKITWATDYRNLTVKYVIENMNTLIARFYHDLCEGDFINAMQKYEIFGQRTTE